jgi:arylsulfatase A-like enzyme
MKNKLYFLIVLFALCSCQKKESPNERPNILYIFTDDQSARTVSCYDGSYPWVETPNIDRLAEKGVKFKYAYTGAKCVPSRGNALTGMLQHNYTKETVYWPVEFRKQGYYTGMIGKWHWNVPRHNETWDWSAVWEHHLPGNMRNYYWDQSLRMHNDTLMPIEYSTDAYTDLTVDFLKERAKIKNQPWYFWLCYGAVHGPYTPADRHIGSFNDAPEMEYPKDIFGPRPDKPEHVVNLETNKRHPETGKPMAKKNQSLDDLVKQYNEAVRAIDDGVGRIMKTLEETGQLENTVVIFTSDQGYAWGHHGYNLKIAPYDANLLAPLIFVQPGKIPEGKENTYPVNGVDIISTIHEMAQVNPSTKLDGRDISELIYQPEKESPEFEKMIQIYTGSSYGNETIKEGLEKAHETGNWKKFNVHPKTNTKAWMMLRDGKYKYVRYIYKDYIEELYDLEKDPEELVNLAVKTEFRKKLSEMRAELLVEFDKSGAQFLDLLPEPLEKNLTTKPQSEK